MESKRKVLIVDDDQQFTKIGKVVLEKNGYEVSVANSAKEGWGTALNWKPDLIVLDVMMESETEGFHFVYDSRKEPTLKETPILMLTAINERDLPWRFDRDDTWLPVDTFLDKPVSPDQLVREVGRMLGKVEA